jgi:phosphoserine phosphatase RsbU/P
MAHRYSFLVMTVATGILKQQRNRGPPGERRLTSITRPRNPADRIPCDGIWDGNKNSRHDIRTSGLAISVYSYASDGAEGGDICYVAVCKSEILTRIVLCDVQGHGSHVSAIAKSIYCAMRNSMDRVQGHRVFFELNQMLLRQCATAHATAALITFDACDSRLYFSYAGHPAILLRQCSEKQWSPLVSASDSDGANLPLGMFPLTHYDQDSVTLRSGDRLALYSDGLVQAESKTGELFGEERLSAFLESCREYDLSYARDCAIQELELHSSGASRADDQTLMPIEIA